MQLAWSDVHHLSTFLLSYREIMERDTASNRSVSPQGASWPAALEKLDVTAAWNDRIKLTELIIKTTQSVVFVIFYATSEVTQSDPGSDVGDKQRWLASKADHLWFLLILFYRPSTYRRRSQRRHMLEIFTLRHAVLWDFRAVTWKAVECPRGLSYSKALLYREIAFPWLILHYKPCNETASIHTGKHHA